MSVISSFIDQYMAYIILALMVLIAILLLISVTSAIQVKKLKKRYNAFTGGKRRPERSLEAQLSEYHDMTERLEYKYSMMCDVIRDMDKNIEKCVQKVGIVRYNPFDEMGGNLCYAVAILDNENNGIVLNGIHSRTGSFTYAKPIELGVSEYVLSVEEKQAIDAAMANGHISQTRAEMIDELASRRIRAYADPEKKKPKIEAEDDIIVEGEISIDEMLKAMSKAICTPEIGGNDFRDTKTAKTLM